MKKFKWSVMSLAVVFSICAAFSTKPHFDCTTMQQYYFVPPNTYVEVSPNYGCIQGTTTCTYYTNNGGITFAPCTVGTYVNCLGCAVQDNKAKANPNSAHSAGSTH
jgi:hypothetical protein